MTLFKRAILAVALAILCTLISKLKGLPMEEVMFWMCFGLMGGIFLGQLIEIKRKENLEKKEDKDP